MNNKATIKVVLNPEENGEKRLLRLRVTFNRLSHFYSLNGTKRISLEQYSNPKTKAYKDAMDEVRNAYDIAVGIVERLGKDFSFEEFRKEYKRELFGEKKVYTSFSSFAEKYIKGLKEPSTQKLYRTAANWVDAVHNGIKLEAVDETFVDTMVAKMKDKGVSENTVRLYCRQLKAIYQNAIVEHNVKGGNPFSNYAKPSTGRTLCGLSNEEFAKLKAYSPKTPSEEFGKDFFILSFACSGANLGDILRLKNDNIKGKTIEFVRHKTKNKNPAPIVIPLIPVATKIFQKYGRIDRLHPEYFILPYLSRCKSEVAAKNKIHDVVQRVNKGLKIICDNVGLRKITTYDARHTYATLARDTGLSVSQLQKMLGHASSKTTNVYLGKLSSSVLDKNSEAINKMLEGDEVAERTLGKEQFDALCEKFGREEVMRIIEANK